MTSGFRYKILHIEWLREQAANVEFSWNDIALHFNKTFGANVGRNAIKRAAYRHKIHRPRELQQFQKGFKPWNKGVKGCMHPNATSFRKGDKPQNVRPIGSVRLTRGGFYLIKVSCEDSRKDWIPVAKAMILEAGIEIPPGHVVFHKNGVPDDDRLENLAVISRQVLARIGHCTKVYGKPYRELSPELQHVVFLQAQLTAKQNEVKKWITSKR